jgi:UDP-galactopyranose mutase
MPPLLIVFSHIRWRSAWARPQQLLSRLAGRWQVVFIEEPVACDGPAWLEGFDVAEHLEVLVPHTPVQGSGFHDDQIAALLPLLLRHLRAAGRVADVAWLTTPMALPLAQALHPACIAYDCMEELADQRHAPRQMRQRESALLKRAALVFTGGPSSWEARRALHPAVHCLPNAVDAAHFASAGDGPGAPRLQSLQEALPRPRLGFHGLIDEQVDLALVRILAERHADWTLVMAGEVAAPRAGKAARPLPRGPNIHWIGPQAHESLPALYQGWDLALMPFVVDDSTRNACPLQTLEYLAAGVPVVSTALRDVAWLYGDAVTVAEPGAEGFVQACEQTLAEGPAQRYRRSLEAMSLVSTSSWERSADTVHALLSQALQQAGRQAHEAPAPLRAVAGGGTV